ncbi:hypothetical protein M8332_01910 [Fructilactobacillus ixorae]|uniref:Uncharacterized protein n=1 Tax=Fructilactobacillus ixorae TaxID=1750535 RepID=A0ABY5C8K0_9LACO|nr:hypothetical protein [Fructilactobacillus ixorae]USS93631.1 hypothetical protein M8332_01910 [Fructilactobacillus ixorae]
MENEYYKLSDEDARIFAKGIVDGNKEYAEERLEKKKKMIVSSGYSWTRSNHIDDSIYRHIKGDENSSIETNISTAGYFWDYIQFNTEVGNNKKVLIIVKPGQFRPYKYGSGIDKKHMKQGSIAKLTKINYSLPSDNVYEFQQQLDIFNATDQDNETIDNKIEEHEFERFYILTYTLDSKSEIGKLSLQMPNPNTLESIEVQDLTPFIEDASQLSDEQREAVANDKNNQFAEYSTFYVRNKKSKSTDKKNDN